MVKPLAVALAALMSCAPLLLASTIPPVERVKGESQEQPKGSEIEEPPSIVPLAFKLGGNTEVETLTTIVVGQSLYEQEQDKIRAEEARRVEEVREEAERRASELQAKRDAEAKRVREADQNKRVSDSTQAIVVPGSVKEIGRSIIVAEFGEQHWPAAEKLIQRESGWNPNARNKSSGACGIPQALPCSKIKDMSVEGQLKWFCAYVRARYGNPTNALNHSYSKNWY